MSIITSPRARRTTFIAVAAVGAAALPAASAAAATYSIETSKNASSSSVEGYASGTPAEIPDKMRIVVKRNGSTVFEKTGERSQFVGDSQGTQIAYAYAGGTFETVKGDVIEMYVGGATPVKTYTETLRPSIDACAIGATKITGKRDSNGIVEGVSAFRPGLQSGDPNRRNRTKLSQSGEDWSAELERGLAVKDVITVFGSKKISNDFFVYRTTQVLAGECKPEQQPAAPAPPPPVPLPPAVNPPLKGLVEKLNKKLVTQSEDGATVVVGVTCSRLNVQPCAGSVGVETLRAFTAQKKKAKKKKPRRVTLGKTPFSIAPGQTKKITVKLNAAGRKLLRKQRKLTVRINVTTIDALNKAITTTTTTTIKAPKAKKKKSRKRG